MKKLLALTLVALLSVSLFGCAQNTPAPTEQIAQPETVAQTQAPQTDAPTTAQTEAETVVETDPMLLQRLLKKTISVRIKQKKSLLNTQVLKRLM